MAVAVSNVGALGMVPFGTPGAPSSIRESIDRLALVLNPGTTYGVNVFVPPPQPLSLSSAQEAVLGEWVAAYNTVLHRHHLEFQVELTEPPDVEQQWKDFESCLEVFISAQVPVVSFHFGLPPAPMLARLREAGVITMACATTVSEALQIRAAGIDFIVAQGAEAGGHRGTFYGTPGPTGGYRAGLTPTLALLDQVLGAVGSTVPVIAAGGIMDGADVVRVIRAGAAGAWMGTAFLTTQEALTPSWQHELLLNPDGPETLVTQGFTGKAARGLATELAAAVEPMQEQLPGLFGLANVRNASAAAKAHGVPAAAVTLAGQSYKRCRRGLGAGELVRALAEEADNVA